MKGFGRHNNDFFFQRTLRSVQRFEKEQKKKDGTIRFAL